MNSLIHFGISVGDLDRAIKWYCTTLGFEETKRFEKESLKISGASLRLGDNTLEILAPYSPQGGGNSGNDIATCLQEVGANHIAICVPNVDTFRQQLQEQSNSPFVSDMVDGRFFFCKDPDGTLLEIRQN